MKGRVIKLDRGYPLVETGAGCVLRCEHATALVKESRVRAVIGDFVEVSVPDGHDKGIIEGIEPRTTSFTRKDPTERTVAQVLAANFDQVMIAEPLSDVNFKRLERELVLAHETSASVSVVLTKSDLAASPEAAEEALERARALAGPATPVLTMSDRDADSVERVRALMPSGSVTVLIGKSGVGKSSLVNVLVGDQVQEIGDVRETDGKGRHTTVSREMVALPGGGFVIDMPGVRGLGLWEADAGIGAAFADVEDLAASCRFRDCKHEREPGCRVRAAVESGELSAERFSSYQALKQESSQVRQRRVEAARLRGEKASDRRSSRPRKR